MAAGFKEMTGYHDNCRCVGIEVRTDESDLPRLNRELRQAWKEATEGKPRTFPVWTEYLKGRRLAAREKVQFPPVPGVDTPAYRNGGYRIVEGVREPLPDLSQLAGHMLYGWRADLDSRRRPDGSISELVRDKTSGGHTAESKVPGKTRFPTTWSDQRIVDAVVHLLETGAVSKKAERREVNGVVDGVRIRVKYEMVGGRAVHLFAFPMKSPGAGTSIVGKRGGVKWH